MHYGSKSIINKVYCFVLMGILSSLFGCNDNPKVNSQKVSDVNDTIKAKEIKLKDNPYPGLRSHALSTTPQDLKIELGKDNLVVYGVIMDFDMGNVVLTVVAFQTGDASLYLSTGQGFIGGFAHENIKQSALDFVKEAQNYSGKANPCDNTPQPDTGCVRFYFLTNKGKYSYQDKVTNLENQNSEWYNLFNLGNNVITQYRLTTQSKK